MADRRKFSPSQCPACESARVKLVKPAGDDYKVLYVDRECEECHALWSPSVTPDGALLCVIMGGVVSIGLIWAAMTPTPPQEGSGGGGGSVLILLPFSTAALSYGFLVLRGKAGHGTLLREGNVTVRQLPEASDQTAATAR